MHFWMWLRDDTGNCDSCHHVGKTEPEGRRPAQRRGEDWAMWEHGDQQWVREHQSFITIHIISINICGEIKTKAYMHSNTQRGYNWSLVNRKHDDTYIHFINWAHPTSNTFIFSFNCMSWWSSATQTNTCFALCASMLTYTVWMLFLLCFN